MSSKIDTSFKLGKQNESSKIIKISILTAVVT